MKFNFVKPTLISCAIGFFIPGFTAILFFLFQLLTDKIGIDCSTSWKSIWILTSLISVALPFIFIEHIKKNPKDRNNICRIIGGIIEKMPSCPFDKDRLFGRAT